MTEVLARMDGGPEQLTAMVIDQADRLFRGEVTKERMAAADRGMWPESIWNAVQQAGLPLALVPEARGGSGLVPADALRLIRRGLSHAAGSSGRDHDRRCALERRVRRHHRWRSLALRPEQRTASASSAARRATC
jgi:hypothetical protein